MIKLVTAETAESGQLWLTISIDASAASIYTRREAATVETQVSKRLVSLSRVVSINGDYSPTEQEFKEYLREVLFKHYVDVISINNFIYDSRIALIQYKQNVILAGFQMVYKYYGEELQK